MSGQATVDWTKIKGIRYSFQRHTLSKYNDCHHYLNENISSEIELPSSIFMEDEITSELATVINDFADRIRHEIVADIATLLEDAPSNFKNDPRHIEKLFDESMMKYKDNNRFVPIRSPNSLTKAASKTITEANDYIIEIFMAIDHWHFDRKKWTAMNFDYVTLEEPASEHQQTGGASQGSNTNTSQEQVEMMAKITEQMERIADKVKDNNPSQSANTGAPGLGTQTNIGTGNTGNPAFYNTANLPANVKDRYDKKDKGNILTATEMQPFILPNPTSTNPNGTVKSNYFCDGPRIVTRDGTLFDLTSTDHSKTATRDKNFLATFPKLYGEKPHLVRKWYQEVLDHCTRLNIYLHPYYLFRKEANHIRGFTVGDADTDDLPGKFQWSVNTWSVLLFTAIRSEKVVPENCTRMRNTMLNYQSGKGYETIYALISMTHPHHLRYPHDLISHNPRQSMGEHLETYYFRYLDFLRLRAYLNDQPGSLDNKNEVSCFIQGLMEKDAIRRKTDEERESTSPEKQAKYKSGALLRTLQVYMDEIIQERGGARRPSTPMRPTTPNPHRGARRNPRPRDSPSTRSNGNASTLTGKSINIVDICGLPKTDPDDEAAGEIYESYCTALYAITAQPKLFDTSKECVVCRNTGHAFENCPVLNDIQSLKDHRIAIAIVMRKMQEANKQLLEGSASISQVNSEPTSSISWQEADEYIPDQGYDMDTEDHLYEDMENHVFDKDNPSDNEVDVPVYSLLDQVPRDPIHAQQLFLEGPRGQLDTGAKVSCTNLKHILHKYRPYTKKDRCPIHLTAAIDGGKLSIIPEGRGKLKVPVPNQKGYLFVDCFYSPRLSSTLISENSFYQEKVSNYSGQTLTKYFDTNSLTLTCYHKRSKYRNVTIYGAIIDGQCYTHPLILPDLDSDSPYANCATSSAFAIKADNAFKTECELASQDTAKRLRNDLWKAISVLDVDIDTAKTTFTSVVDAAIPIHAIRAKTAKLLWHQRLGHPCDEYLYNAHKFIDGVPKFSRQTSILDQCPTCIQSKQTKESPGKHSTRVATQPYQGLSIDFSFSGMKSANSDRRKDYEGINGETAWIIISDHFTGMKHGDTRISKAAPLHWLEHFFSQYNPDCANKYVYLDQGGELFNNPDVKNLFATYGYEILPTGADSSHQNGPVERAHRTLGNAIRALLTGANMPIKFWPYAFYHAMRLANAFPERGHTMSPLEKATSRKENLRSFRTFGCRVWVRPPGKRKAKFKNNSRKGLFLGFVPYSTRNILCLANLNRKAKATKRTKEDFRMRIRRQLAPIEDDLDMVIPTMDIHSLRAITKLHKPENRNLPLDTGTLPDEVIMTVVNAINSKATTPEEQAIGHFTRRKLKKLSTWHEWEAGERKQLDQFTDLQMFGKPILPPNDPRAIILRPHWQYHVKRCGTRRARACCNASKYAAPLLHAIAMTYSSCVEHPIQRLFFAIAANLNLKVYGGDAKDAYGHSPGPEISTYMTIDDQYADWYRHKYGKEINRKMVLPVLRALQGHPESGRLWETHVNKILKGPKLNFQNTTHDKTIYTTDFKGEKVYLLRQVDDFALACSDAKIADEIYDIIGNDLKLPTEDEVPFTKMGLITDFNGIDVEQSKEFIELSCSNYIDRIMTSHGWETDRKMQPSDKPISPLPMDVLTQLQKHKGPEEGTKEHHALQEKMGFSYRTLLGEMMFAYVSCRPDIGYAVTGLRHDSCSSNVDDRRNFMRRRVENFDALFCTLFPSYSDKTLYPWLSHSKVHSSVVLVLF